MDSQKPFWSVMIPTYNAPENFLAKSLRSILQQDPGPKTMQIEIVDDCSPKGAPVALAQQIARNRVVVHCEPMNKGMAGTWNRCIERARGQWVHILHQDDYVLPGFYDTLARAAQLHPDLSLLATRSFYVDTENVILQSSPRLRDLENGGHKVDDFFYQTPIQCPGVVVKRPFYESHGGFRSDLTYLLDCEMWARVVGIAGGLVTSEILSCFRNSDKSESGRLNRTAESMCDYMRLDDIFAARYPGFSRKIALRRTLDLSLSQAQRFAKMSDSEAVKANLDFWWRHAPTWMRLRRLAGYIKRIILRQSWP